MELFSVYLNDDLDVEKAKFIPSNFSFKAFLFVVLWALFNRLWLFSFILIGFEFAIFSVFALEMISYFGFFCSKLFLMIYAGCSANFWRQLKYSSSKFQETIIAINELDAHKIWFENFTTIHHR